MDWSWMTNYKLRLVIGGSIVSIIGAILIVVLGFKAFFAGLLVVGIIALAAGLLWMGCRKAQASAVRSDSQMNPEDSLIISLWSGKVKCRI